MNENFYALLIGINISDTFDNLEFAEKDCHDLSELLTHSDIYDVPEQNIVLITGNDVTVSNVKDQVNSHLMNRKSNDVVLLYYSGKNIIAGSPPRNYLLTSDFSLENLKDNIEMDYLNKALMGTQASMAILITDCDINRVYSKRRNDSKFEPDLLFKFESSKEKISIISNNNNISKEISEFQNGALTYFLLRALKEEAVNPLSGQVKVGRLVNYLKARCYPNREPYFSGAGLKSDLAILSQKKNSLIFDLTQKTKSLDHRDQTPLNSHLKLVDFFLTLLSNNEKDECSIDQIVNVLQEISSADFVFYIENNSVYSQATEGLRGPEINYYIAKIRDELENPRTLTENELHFRDAGKLALVFQLESSEAYLAFCGTDKKRLLEIKESLKIITHGLCLGTDNLNHIRLPLIDAGVLDATYEEFRFLPDNLSEHRFELFFERLSDIVFYYEPIIRLARHNPYFTSWEALARDYYTKRVPSDVFQAAELWGEEFTTLMDMYFLRHALENYSVLWNETGLDIGLKRPISINVYPQSILDDRYILCLKSIVIDEEIIIPEKLVLEISEKSALPKEVNNQDLFTIGLKKIINLNVGIGIDDFGASHASIERLAELEPSFVKIDKSILHYAASVAKHTIKLVKGVLQDQHNHPITIVIEGLDKTSSLNFSDLYRLDVLYAQGYEIGMAAPHLDLLNGVHKKEIIEKIKDMK